MPRRPMMTSGLATMPNPLQQQDISGNGGGCVMATTTDHMEFFENELSDEENGDEDFWASTALTSMVYTTIQNINSKKKNQMKHQNKFKKRQFLSFNKKSRSKLN